MKHAKKKEHITKSQENHSQQEQIHKLIVGLTDKKLKSTVINMFSKLQEKINIMAEYVGYFKTKFKKIKLTKEPNRNSRTEK